MLDTYARDTTTCKKRVWLHGYRIIDRLESANPCQSPICDRFRKSGKHEESLGTISRLPKLWPGLPSYSNVVSSAALSHSVSAVLLQPAPPPWTCAHKAWKGEWKSWCGILENFLCLLETSRNFMHILWRTMRTIHSLKYRCVDGPCYDCYNCGSTTARVQNCKSHHT